MKKMNPKLLERLEKGFTVKVPRRIIEFIEAQQVPRKTKLPTTRKQSLREREDAEMLKRSQGIYGVQLPTEYDDAPGSAEELLRRCEEEMRGHEGFDEVFRLPLGTALPEKQRDFADAVWFLYEARDKLKADDQEGAMLELFKLARILERLRIVEITNPTPRKSSDFLRDAAKAAWIDCGRPEGRGYFEDLKTALEAHGVKETTEEREVAELGSDGVRRKSFEPMPSGKVSWQEPDGSMATPITLKSLQNKLSDWKKEWLQEA